MAGASPSRDWGTNSRRFTGQEAVTAALDGLRPVGRSSVPSAEENISSAKASGYFRAAWSSCGVMPLTPGMGNTPSPLNVTKRYRPLSSLSAADMASMSSTHLRISCSN